MEHEPLTYTPPYIRQINGGYFFPRRVEAPRLRVDFGVEMDVAKRIHDVGSRGDQLVVYVHIGPEIASHGCVRLGDAESLPYDRIEDGSMGFPNFKRDPCEAGGEPRRG
jgi:hypothetical protein